MSVFREKFTQKSKLNKQSTHETMESFDQNSLHVTVSTVKSQLSTIKLTCSWNKQSLTKKSPQLQCKWYNKTQTDIKQIVGVNGSTYQACLLDVGSIVHIQCVPTLAGIQYEGMPIIKEIGPIGLDLQTEEQSQDLLNSQKATFFVKISVDGSGTMEQGLIKINENQILFLLKKQDKTSQPIYSGIITQSNPCIEVNRVNSKELTFTFNENSIKIRVLFGDHKIRDVFLLFLKLIIGKKFLKQQPLHEQENLVLKSKTSATDLISLGDLKKQIVKNESEKEQLNKLLKIEKNKNEDMQLKNRQLSQRLQNLNKNYFQLERQLNDLKSSENVDKQRLSYYKNQNANLRQDTQMLAETVNLLEQSLKIKSQLLTKYQQNYKGKQSYQLIAEKLNSKNKEIESLSYQLNNAEHQIKLLEEKLSDYQYKYEEMNNQKQHITRKYESLLNEKNLTGSPSKNSAINQNILIQQKHQDDQKSIEEKPDLTIIMRQRQKQLIELKQQIRHLAEQNNSLKIIMNKQSSKTGKTKFKLQLLEMKKIIGKLTETVTQKDIALLQMRKINKELNQKVIQLNAKKVQQMNI